MTTQLYPYTERDGIRTLTDSQVMALYDRMVGDGTARTVFAGGIVTNRETFLRFMKETDNRLFLVMEGGAVYGIAWMNNFHYKSCQGHFCFFKEAWGGNSVRLGRFGIKTILNFKVGDEYWLDVIVGPLLVNNPFAIQFCEKIGMRKIGTIPHGGWDVRERKSIDVDLYCATREIFGVEGEE